MLKTSLTAGLLACAMAAPAFAQTATPAAEPPAAAGQMQSGAITYMERIETTQFRGSDLMGRTVYNEQNENIGNIGDVVLDRQGQIQGVVIDVGGFLGLGASEVAVPFTALRFEPAAAGSQMAATNTAEGRAATTGTATDGAATNNMAAPNAGTNNEMAANNANAQPATDASSDSTLLDRVILATTRQDLENAPKFDDAPARQDGESSAR
jgi:sporulation protein YlmC with PRC-barrel domain